MQTVFHTCLQLIKGLHAHRGGGNSPPHIARMKLGATPTNIGAGGDVRSPAFGHGFLLKQGAP